MSHKTLQDAAEKFLGVKPKVEKPTKPKAEQKEEEIEGRDSQSKDSKEA